MTDLIILAGGFGTRLNSVSQGRPKALMPVGKNVFLDIILKKITRYNINNIYLSLHYKPKLFKEFLNNHNYSKKIIPVIEPVPMGTGGAIKFIIDKSQISSPFFVINGDTLSTINLNRMIEYFYKTKYSGIIGISFVKNAERYGTVKYRKDCLTDFVEKGCMLSGWINNGHYLLKKEIFKGYKEYFSAEKILFPDLVKKHEIGIFKVENDDFIDMGIKENYEKLCSQYQ